MTAISSLRFRGVFQNNSRNKFGSVFFYFFDKKALNDKLFAFLKELITSPALIANQNTKQTCNEVLLNNFFIIIPVQIIFSFNFLSMIGWANI